MKTKNKPKNRKNTSYEVKYTKSDKIAYYKTILQRLKIETLRVEIRLLKLEE